MTYTKTILVVEEKSGEFVWHVFWAHNQEVDQMANLGAKGVKKVQMADKINGRRKATRGRWDGSAKSGGRSGCGVCSALREHVGTFDRDRGRPKTIVTKLWQSMQSRETKNMNLEKEDLEDILSPMRKVGWSEEETAARLWKELEGNDQRESPARHLKKCQQRGLNKRGASLGQSNENLKKFLRHGQQELRD